MLIAACSGTPAAPTPDPLSGEYNASGGGGALPVVQALATRFTELHPKVKWNVVESGSSAAIKGVQSKTIDLGFTSRALTDDEAKQLVSVPIGFSGTAVIVNMGNPIPGLARDQLQKIYNGEITNWMEVGGPDLVIRAYMREPNAATRMNFESYVYGTSTPAYGKSVIVMYETEALLTAVGSFRGSIGVATIGSRTASDTRLRMLPIDGVAPDQESLSAGKYKMMRPLFLVALANTDGPKPVVQAFLDFAKSAEGQRVAASAY
jgi:phosphate transport system substrate-binding protein